MRSVQAALLGFGLWCLAGCALVGFDRDAGPAGSPDVDAAHDGGRDQRMDGAVVIGTPDGGDAGRDASTRMDAGGDAGGRDASDRGDASVVPDAAVDDDAGLDCPEVARCEGSSFVECEGGVRRVTDCETLASTCHVARCDANNGCVVAKALNGVHCEDGLRCTLNDTCADGNCTPGPSRNCEGFGGACRLGVCNESSGACEAMPNNQGLTCGGGELTCDNGICSSGALCASDGCSLDCLAAFSPCGFDCSGFGTCNFNCGTGATCQFDCTGAGANCQVSCAAGSVCTVLCTDQGDCQNVTCDAAATCTLQCGAGPCG